MNQEDHAVVVGIRAYLGWQKLEGPVNDARAMKKWLESPSGGGVPKENIHFITTKPPIKFQAAEQAKPTAAQIQDAFNFFQACADENFKNGLGSRVGRRLWIYMSGHGFGVELNEAALLSANSDSNNFLEPFHMLGVYTASYFYKRGVFDEIILLMDCCRNSISYDILRLYRPWGWNTVTDQNAVKNGKLFCAFATNVALFAVERKMSDQQVHGVFTRMVLDGLGGKAAETGKLEISTQSLSNYLKNETIFKSYFGPGEADSQEIGFPSVQNYSKEFTIVTLPNPVTYLVTFHIPPALVGKPALVLDGIDLTRVLAETPAVPEQWQLNLERGSYSAEISGVPPTRKAFTLTGAGGAKGEEERNVQF